MSGLGQGPAVYPSSWSQAEHIFLRVKWSACTYCSCVEWGDGEFMTHGMGKGRGPPSAGKLYTDKKNVNYS